jgi:hypothetical protein
VFDLPTDDDLIRNFIRKNAIHNTTLCTLSQFEHSDLTLNWIRSLVHYGVTKFVVLCLDMKIRVYLAELGYEQHAVFVPRAWLEPIDETVTLVRFQERDVVQYRAAVLSKLMLAVKGHRLVYSDTDVVWQSTDVIEHLLLTFTHASTAEVLFAVDELEVKRSQIVFNPGFFLARSAPFTQMLFHDMLEWQLKQPGSRWPSSHRHPSLSFLRRVAKERRAIGLDRFLYPLGETCCFAASNRSDVRVRPMVVRTGYLMDELVDFQVLKDAGLWFL